MKRLDPSRWPAWARALATVALVAVATALGAAAGRHFSAADHVMLYLLAIIVAAAAFGRAPAVVASLASVVAYNFFFVAPYHTLAVADERDLLTFATLVTVGLVISILTARLREHEQQALERLRQTAALYSLSRDLAAANDLEQAARAAAADAAATFACRAEVLLAPPARPPTPTEARFAFDAGAEGAGALVLSREGLAPGSAEWHLAAAFAAQAAAAFTRIRLAEATREAELQVQTERMRSALLSAVSHDLRTPLGAITGAATTLRDAGAAVDAKQRGELLDTLCEEAERLERFVLNLLEMTRVQSGALEVKREWVPLEELVGSALTRLEARLEGRPVRVQVPQDLPLLSVDPVLMEQVFFNLLDNAEKHTPKGTLVELSARIADGAVLVEVSDRGAGPPPGEEELIFEKFHRGKAVAARGSGLGLAICRGIVDVHGGRIWARRREGGGATFTVQLPLALGAPTVPEEVEPG